MKAEAETGEAAASPLEPPAASGEPGEKGSISFISVNKLSQPSAIPTLQGAQEGEKYLCSNSHGVATTIYSEPKGAWGVNKTRMLALRAEMHTKGLISGSPDPCVLPFTEKV